MNVNVHQSLSTAKRLNITASEMSSADSSTLDKLRSSTDTAKTESALGYYDPDQSNGRLPFEAMSVEHPSVVAMMNNEHAEKNPSTTISEDSATRPQEENESDNASPVTTTIQTVFGDVTITSTPNEDWVETVSSAGGGAAVGGGLGVLHPIVLGNPVTASATALAAGAGAVGGFESAVDHDISVRPNVFSATLQAFGTWVADFVNPTTPNPLTSSQTGTGSDGPGSDNVMSGAESAEAADYPAEGEFGGSPTATETGSGTTDSGLSTSQQAANEFSNGNWGGEYGGTPTAPEPVSYDADAWGDTDWGVSSLDDGNTDTGGTPTAGSSNTDGESNSSSGGGGVSSTQSAVDGDYGTVGPDGTVEDEFSGTPTVSQPTSSSNSLGSSNTDGESNSSSGGSDVSSSQSAEDSGYGTSSGGEYD